MKLPMRPAAMPSRHSGGVADGPGGAKEAVQPQEIDSLPAGVNPHGDDHAEKPAVKRHAALPDGEDLERIRRVVRRLVEQQVAQPPAEDHAEHGEKDEVVELLA